MGFAALGTQVQLAILAEGGADRARIRADLDTARHRIHRYEKLLSRFDPDSELSRINRRSGEWIAVGQELMELLSLSEQAIAWTGGWFHPGLGQVMETIGYGGSFDQIPVRLKTNVTQMLSFPKDTVAFPAGPLRCPYEWSPDKQMVRLLPGFQLDLGGLAKGWIVEQAAQLLEGCRYANFVCDAGGDLVCRGQNGDTPWQISIEDPFHPEQDLFTLDVQSLAVATSGTYRRQWLKEGVRMHHLINPHSGQPAESDLISCTVIHPKLVTAELMAKTALMMGSQTGPAWLSAKGASGWLAVTQSGQLIHSWQS